MRRLCVLPLALLCLSLMGWSGHTAEGWWQANRARILNGFHNGQCTDVVAHHRPDLIRRIDEHAYQVHDGGALHVSFAARVWVRDALWAHIPIGHSPRPGAVVVFQPGAFGASSGGHLALVDRVYRNGSFRILEEHAPRLWVLSHRVLPTRAARDRRVAFIY